MSRKCNVRPFRGFDYSTSKYTIKSRRVHEECSKYTSYLESRSDNNPVFKVSEYQSFFCRDNQSLFWEGAHL